MRPPSTRHANRAFRSDTAMTPMIDVVFLLLVFFVCASIGREADQLLPTPLAGGAVAAEEIEPEDRPLGDVRVELLRAGGVTRARMQNRDVDLPALESRLLALAAAATDIPVILDVAGDVPMEDVLLVYDTAREAGFEAVQFAADRR